jgi:Uma2 family endonuclease
MTYLLDTSTDQRSFHKGITWEKFKLIEQGFSDSPSVKLFYYKGELEILAVSPEHEMFSGIIGMLLENFFLELEVEFEITGSMTQEKEGEASAQADESYCIGEFKRPPDLSVEVIFTSGSAKKLALYQALEVPEVWLWEDGLFTFHHLRENGYEQIYRSELPYLKDLDLDLLTRCVLQAQTSKVQAVKMLKQGMRMQKLEGNGHG